MGKGRESKPHIGIFGRRNNGKSSLINALAQQEIAIVSDVPGTTTDPVRKSMEIPGIGPAILVDTAGIDDTGELGAKRVNKSLATLKTVDLAVLVITNNHFDDFEIKLVDAFRKQDVPFIVIHNKSDVIPPAGQFIQFVENEFGVKLLPFCALDPQNLEEVIAALRQAMPETAYRSRSLLGDLLSYGDLVVLITPIDNEAPEGRLILPQVQAIRDIIDNDCIAVVVKEKEVDALMKTLRPRPSLVVTDSQVFLRADASVPRDIPLTSFSIMLARHKGDFENYLRGTPKIAELKDDDRVLLLESCTHHVACDDIGRVKIPRWMSNYTGKKLHYDVVAGLGELPRPITDYALVVQCGGCMITRKQIKSRLQLAVENGVPVTNYGMAIAWMHGIYHRAVAPFTMMEQTKEDYL
ncbi:MAG: [FeFe] hydrogenase H-cluster maturation GTPase HydF [Bacteroidia bacterium]|nr:MAG: [FeFe] hydrogenase H-cluster maturation GTPase HydF [Bacteroidia bacterium]